MAQRAEALDVTRFYGDNAAHLVDELAKLDILIRQQVGLLRRQRQAAQGMAVSQGVYISPAQVDALLAQKDCEATELAAVSAFRHHRETLQWSIDNKLAASAERGIVLALPRLAELFSLTPLELQTLIICLAPELQRKYDTLYAYLQDDITRKRPSVDLVLDLLCESQTERWRARRLFAEQAPLFRHGILQRLDDPRSPSGSSGLAQFLQLDQRILHYFLEAPDVDGRLAGLTTLLYPSSALDQVAVDANIKTGLVNFSHAHFSQPGQRLVLYFYGPYGVGKRDLALGLCAQWYDSLLYLDMELLLTRDEQVPALLRRAFRESLLLGNALYIDHADSLLGDLGKAKGWLKTLAQMVEEYAGVTFLAGAKPWSEQEVFDQESFCAVELPVADVSVRQTAWERALQLLGSVPSTWAGQLASGYRLTPGQIQAALAWAKHQCAMGGGEQALTLVDLYAACRQQSQHKLGGLAVKIEPHYQWQDIVLPSDKLQQLKEICGHMTYRYRVFREWGFAAKLTRGCGVSALFAGPSGTGKTMAAEVLAHALQLDLYKIDLSGVVSKYIGETEKNLANIFQEAESSNAILFFDEADALFGKRTKIADAHDRYANIETSYLLQRMEVYEGMVILATNLRENMDEAFTRRLRFIVEFPFPDAASRKTIWERHFPGAAPISEDLDYAWLAEQFQITGGNIKNIVLNAAFLAAADAAVIGPEHVLRGAKREFEKIGKLWNDKRFAQPNS